MGAAALQGNGVTTKILYLFHDAQFTPDNDPLRRVRISRLVLFILIQLAGFGATFAIVQTIGRFVRQAGIRWLTRKFNSRDRFPGDNLAFGSPARLRHSFTAIHMGGIGYS